MSEKRTELKELGEFGLIEKIGAQFKLSHPESVKGIGDDAAVVKCGSGYTVITSDVLMEGIHFDLSYMPLKHLGYKAVVVNISDVCAMNGIPKQILVNIGLSNRFFLEAVEELYEGIKAACTNYKVDLIGGDTSSSSSGLFISITAIGTVTENHITYRSKAKKDDIICVTGDLGAAYCGLQVLEREKQVFLSNPQMQPELENYKYIVQRQLRPEARADIVHELREKSIVPTAMIDISDGLASDLMHICHQSKVGAQIHEDKLPIDQMTYNTSVEFKLNPITCALNGGEDYELLFTIAQKDFEKLKDHADIHIIGYITEDEKGRNLITRNGNAVPLKAQGWQHF